MLFAVSGCLVPPDGDPPVDVVDDPPVIDLESLDPAEATLKVTVPVSLGGSCRIRFAARISDFDDSVVRVRWVADNKKSIVRLLEDDEDFTLPEGVRFVVRTVETRDLSEPLVEVPHTISLFVSDGVGWDATRDEIDEGTSKTDFGRLARTDGGLAAGSVVEVRWFLTFEDGGECDGP